MQEIRSHWNRSLEALDSAKLLLRHKRVADAVSRAYYAILHSARAALLVYNIIPKSHTSLRQAFGLHLVKNGDIEMEWAKILSIENRYRTDADYMEVFDIEDETAETLVEDAEKFLLRIKVFFGSQGRCSRMENWRGLTTANSGYSKNSGCFSNFKNTPWLI